MQLVYDRFETIESNLHKAYYHLEDIDPEMLNKFIEDNIDDPDIHVSGNDVIYTIHEDGDDARTKATLFFSSFNISCIAGLDFFETKGDYTKTSFASNLICFYYNLDDSLALYITYGIKHVDYSLLISSVGKLEAEKFAELLKAEAVKYFGFERLLDYSGIHLDSASIKKGKEILANESALEFYKWFNQLVPNISFNDIKFRTISNPIMGAPERMTKEAAIYNVQLLEHCIKKHETEYWEWRTENAGLTRRKTAIISRIDSLHGRFSLQYVFYKYYILVEGHILDKMFNAMNEETSDGNFNKLLVEAVRNFPDPQFAIEVNERYKEYKRYNPGCIDLPFVDQDAEPKLMAPLNRQEDNTRNFDVRLGKYLEVSLEREDVAALYNCFYQMFDSETKKGDILYYLSTGADDGLVHNGIKWQGSREELALFLQGVLPRKKRGFWKAVYKVFRIKKNDEWVKTKDLNKINSREWDTKDNRKECEKLESLYNNWMIRRPNLKGKWEFRDWHKNS